MIRFSNRDILSRLTHKTVANDIKPISGDPAPTESADLKLFPLGDIPGAERVLIRETEHWVVVPALCSLTPGHISFLPKKNKIPFLKQSEDIQEEFRDLLWEMVYSLQAYYSSSVCLFEEAVLNHNGYTESRIHLAPLPTDCYAAARFLYDDWQEIETGDELKNTAGGYWLLTLFDGDEETTIFRPTTSASPKPFFTKLFTALC